MGDPVVKVGVWDAVLSTDTPATQVIHGPTTTSIYNAGAVAATTTQHNFQVTIPSLVTYIDKTVLWESTVQISFLLTLGVWQTPGLNREPYAPLIVYGRDFALASFPLHRLCSTMTVQINNMSLTQNLSQVFVPWVRMFDNPLGRARMSCPAKLDVFAQSFQGGLQWNALAPLATVGVASTTNPTAVAPFGGATTTVDPATKFLATAGSMQQYVGSPFSDMSQTPYGEDPGNGAWPIQWLAGTASTTAPGVGSFTAPYQWPQGETVPNTGGSSPSGIPAGTLLTPAYNNAYWGSAGSAVPPQGDFFYNNGGFYTPSANPAGTYQLAFQFNTAEPLMISPFAQGGEILSPESGLLGVANIQATMVMQTPDVARIIRVLNPASVQPASFLISNVNYFNGGFAQTTTLLKFKFYTAPSTRPIPLKNTVPLMQFVCYPTALNATIPGVTSYGLQSTGSQTTNTINLPGIPNFVILRVIAQASAFAPANTAEVPAQYANGDWQLPITNVNVTFDNLSGILSTMRSKDLYRISQQNGLQMSYLQWLGNAQNVPSAATIPQTNVGNAGSKWAPTAATTQYAQLTGGDIILNFGGDIPLAVGLAPGVAGNYSFSAAITFTNTYAAAVTPTIQVIAVSNGFLTTSQGNCELTFTPVSETDVIATLNDNVTSAEVAEAVGSSHPLAGAGRRSHRHSNALSGRKLRRLLAAKAGDEHGGIGIGAGTGGMGMGAGSGGMGMGAGGGKRGRFE